MQLSNSLLTFNKNLKTYLYLDAFAWTWTVIIMLLYDVTFHTFEYILRVYRLILCYFGCCAVKRHERRLRRIPVLYKLSLLLLLGESGANWHPTCFCSRGCCQPMAMMFLCCTYTNQNTKNLWRPNPSWFKNYHDKPFLNHMSILF